MANAAYLIRRSLARLGLIGASQPTNGDDAAHMLSILNTMLDAWRVEHLMAFQDSVTVATLNNGVASLTIGPAQEIDVARPSRIELGSFTRVGDIDRPLMPVSLAEYNAITRKAGQYGAWPEVCYLDAGSPTGRLYFWPTVAAELHIVTRTMVLRFADLTTDYPLAPGYERTIIDCLAVEAAPDFEIEPRPQIVAAAMNGKRALKAANTTVPQLDIGGHANNQWWQAPA